MIKVKARANYGFAETDMEFEEEFLDDVTDEEIEENIRDMVMEQGGSMASTSRTIQTKGG